MNVRVFASIASGVFALGLSSPAWGQGASMPPGQIRAVRIVGEVKVVHSSNPAAIELHNNDALAQGDIVTTAKDSSVVLVFSNGSTINLGQDSRMAVDEFLQDPFSQEVKVSQLTNEPSASHTKLTLTYGELVGNVKKLHGESSFLVQTPVGAAGIRGTTFRLVYRPSGTGQAFFTLSTASGEVIFQGATGAPVPVPANKEVDIQVTVDAAGNVQSTQVTSQDISPEAAQVIEQQVTQAVDSIKDTVFPTTQNAPGGNQPPATPPPPQPPPNTTPGDGQTG